MATLNGEALICPTCRTVIGPGEQCPAGWGMFRCMEAVGHDGWHWTDTGRANGSVLIWTGIYSRRSCPERLSLRKWCQKPPGHEGPHNDGQGLTWSEVVADDADFEDDPPVGPDGDPLVGSAS